MTTPMLRFVNERREPFHEAHWTGPWPSPERFLVLIGQKSGIVRIWPEDEELSEDWLAAMEHPTITRATFVRRAYSQLPGSEEELRAAGLIRGAEYAAEGLK